jgi:hypothetical protein
MATTGTPNARGSSTQSFGKQFEKRRLDALKGLKAAEARLATKYALEAPPNPTRTTNPEINTAPELVRVIQLEHLLKTLNAVIAAVGA